MMERAMIKHQSSKGPNTSFVAVNCPFPVQFDVYWGCSHKCKYCFANKRGGFNSGESRVESDDGIMRYGTARQLADWIKGKRSKSEAWCDWNIPIKFGTNSDPFQPCELKERATLKCLKVLAKTGYPFILISKGATIAARPEYLAVLKDCNVLFHLSLCCARHDALEKGAPTYEERLSALHKLSTVCKRTVARWQPYFYEFHKDAMREIPRVKDAGAYGILVQGAYLQKPLGLCNEKQGAKFFYPDKYVRRWTQDIKRECHKNGLVFLTSDMYAESDEIPCCGVMDLPDFEPSRCNSLYRILAPEKYKPTCGQCAKGSALGILNFARRKKSYKQICKMSFREVVEDYADNPETIAWTERG